MPVNLPQYTQDPFYKPTQTALTETGLGMLRGEVPEYFAPIGAIGGQTFENMMRGVTTDIQRTVTEDLARRGIRGGGGAEAIGTAISRVTPQLRFQEMLRGIEGRKGLLGLGAEITGGARTAALQAGAGRRAFELGTAELGISREQFQQSLALNKEQFTANLEEQKRQFTEELQRRRDAMEISAEQFDREMELKNRQLAMQAQMWEDQKEQQKAQAKGEMWGNIIKGIGTIGGMALGGPLGGMLGGKLGGMVGGGGGDMFTRGPAGTIGAGEFTMPSLRLGETEWEKY